MRLARAGLVVLLAVPLLGAEEGCKADREVAVSLVRAGAQCGGAATEPSVRRLASEAELAAAFPDVLGAPPSAAPEFEGAVVLLVAAGQRPTAGHGVELAAAKAPVKDGTALVRVTVRAPEQGAITAQVVTSPCLVVSLPREGLREVKVADGADRVLGSVAVE